MTFLYIRSAGFGEPQGLCGGTLIDQDTILTAAHCFAKPILPSAILAHIRRHNLSRTAEEEDGDVVGVSDIYLHPDWNMRTLTNDGSESFGVQKSIEIVLNHCFVVAILKLARPTHVPASISLDAGETLRPGLVVRAMGWGLNSELRHTQTLQQVDLEVFSGGKCLSEYSKQLPTFDPHVAICVGTKGGGKNVCFGDSGGPLITMTKNGPVLVGTTSYGASCNPAIPAVFARIDVKEAWISQFMKQADNENSDNP
ncbi:trypsin-like serine protease [Basidiobolus meristosporus CBS 931.73]|uniref:Trypsin-like serine protease n=1 Tax=Basidiobolus meristosporus CBS 931.73 TaxID=1314790 RepID=A0A1Y1YV84_9FUNG|nr:trypsin-like serine protease [Basidiobolus meristosporus CBS 931.73]|eukprot:ORY01942.1 trypsin-like serine protease [Basidiobolus meristosporus CBS 931.73]